MDLSGRERRIERLVLGVAECGGFERRVRSRRADICSRRFNVERSILHFRKFQPCGACIPGGRRVDLLDLQRIERRIEHVVFRFADRRESERRLRPRATDVSCGGIHLERFLLQRRHREPCGACVPRAGSFHPVDLSGCERRIERLVLGVAECGGGPDRQYRGELESHGSKLVIHRSDRSLRLGIV